MSIARFVCATFIILVILAWSSLIFRFELQTIPNQEGYAVAYRLDRWTGALELIEDDQWYPVTEGNPDELRAMLNPPRVQSY